MNKDQLLALDAMIGETLARAPTTKQNEDHLRAIEEDAFVQLDADVRCGAITVDEETTALIALHRKIYPEATQD